MPMGSSVHLCLPIFLCFLLLLSSDSGGTLRLVHGQAPEGPEQGAWCVAKPSSSDQELQANIDYACNYVSCDVIKPEGVCFEPNNRMNHASVSMNLYYQKFGRNSVNCNFSFSGIVAVTDPSYGNCKYAIYEKQ